MRHREVKSLPSITQLVSGGAGIFTQVIWLLITRLHCTRRAPCWADHDDTVSQLHATNIKTFQRIFVSPNKANSILNPRCDSELCPENTFISCVQSLLHFACMLEEHSFSLHYFVAFSVWTLTCIIINIL